MATVWTSGARADRRTPEAGPDPDQLGEPFDGNQTISPRVLGAIDPADDTASVPRHERRKLGVRTRGQPFGDAGSVGGLDEQIGCTCAVRAEHDAPTV